MHHEASTLVSVTLAWDPPVDSGGLPVLGYKAECIAALPDHCHSMPFIVLT